MNNQYTLAQIEQAAIYFLKFSGQRGTPKQVDKLYKQASAESIVRMALERGWKA